ncbi:MAG: GTPase RsgA, partial [Betaproteobacteria bacterium]
VVVGDRVRCSGVVEPLAIEAIEPRRSLLYRSDANRLKELAANIDQVAIVFAPQPPFNPRFLWRALAAAEAAGIGALAVLYQTGIGPGLDAARRALAVMAAWGGARLGV